MSERTVTINGTLYDAHTGMPIQQEVAVQPTQPSPIIPQSEAHHSDSVHQVIQKSQTLNRQIVQKTDQTDKKQTRPTVEKSPAITKFAPHPIGAKSGVRIMSDIGPVMHPMTAKAQHPMHATGSTQKLAPKPSHVIKQEAVAQALEKAPGHNANAKQTKHKKRYSRMLSVASASLALLLLGGYFTYLNMPSLSVRVAASQAGVNASYPTYRPDGYSLNGPVAYSQGEVTMKFAANAGPQNFTVNQAKSSWDSSAVLDNYVKQKAGDNYIAYNEHGLTIYTFDGNAAWVNGGILYTIAGDAPLSSDQIRHIATSM